MSVTHALHIAVPKTGTTSVQHILRASDLDLCVLERHVPLAQVPTHDHDHVVITTTRSPLDVYSSFFFHVKRLRFAAKELEVPFSSCPKTYENVAIAAQSSSVEEFLLSCTPDSFHSYIWSGQDPRNFDFVGDYTRSMSSTVMLARFIGRAPERVHLNANPSGSYFGYKVDEGVAREFAKRCAGDLEAHTLAQERFAQLLKQDNLRRVH